MSKLDELIAELCPDGVEYKTIGETVGVNRGKRLVKSQLSDNGAYEVYHGSKESILGRYDQYNAPANTTIVVNTGGIGGVKFLEKPFWCSDGSFWLGKSSEINSKYLYYCLSGYEDYFYSQKRIGGVPTIDRSVIENFQIPVPPLAVQEEIVRILDTFTSLTAELTAELTARRKQYEYYRDSLLTRETKVEIKKLGEIAEIGVGNKPEQILEEKTKYKYINAGTTNSGYTVTSNCKGDTVTTPSRGQGGIGFVGYQKNDFYLGPLCYKIRSLDTKLVLNKYIFYYLQSNNEQILKIKNSGGVPSVNRADLINITISLPPLSVQQRIVNVLDNFDAICSDLKIGLPAEIDARKKQYEYYRDLLLTFAERGNTISSSSAVQQFSRIEEIRLLQYVFGYAIVRLGEIATEIYRGSGITRDQVTEDGISCVRYGEIYTTYGIWFDKCVSHTHLEDISSCKYFEHGDILFAITGESVEDIAKSTAYVGEEKCLAGGDIVVMKHKQNPKFLSYVLSTTDAQKQKGKGKVKSKVVHSSVPAISEITIPLPTLEEQERIVKILDRFDSLCNDISSGLPAEIEARQKQYEYYRDKLLAFEKKKV